MFVLLTDFSKVEYLIPYTTETQAGIEQFIADKEVEILKELVGRTFYEALSDGVSALPADWDQAVDYAIDVQLVFDGKIYKSLQTPNLGKTPDLYPLYWEEQPENKWLLLKVGESYFNSKTNLKNHWEGMKQMLVPAIYWHYLKEYSTSQTGIGRTQPTTENAEVVDPVDIMVKAWNVYQKRAFGEDEKDSFYGYLVANNADFDEDVEDSGYDDFEQYLSLNFEDPGTQNIFNL